MELIILKGERFFTACVIEPRSFHFYLYLVDIIFFHREHRVDWEIQHDFEIASNLPEGNALTSNSLTQWSLKMDTEDWDPAGMSSFFSLPLPFFLPLHSFICLTSSYIAWTIIGRENGCEIDVLSKGGISVIWLPAILVSSHKEHSDKHNMGRLEKGWKVYPWPYGLHLERDDQRTFDFLFLLTSWFELNGH